MKKRDRLPGQQREGRDLTDLDELNRRAVSRRSRRRDPCRGEAIGRQVDRRALAGIAYDERRDGYWEKHWVSVAFPAQPKARDWPWEGSPTYTVSDP